MAMTTTESKSAAIRARLKYPIIDSDGHTAEFEPALFDYLRKCRGRARRGSVENSLSNRSNVLPLVSDDAAGIAATIRAGASACGAAHPTLQHAGPCDQFAAQAPCISGCAEMGLDFTIVYPSCGMSCCTWATTRCAGARAARYNNLYARYFREYGNRMTPAAVIPMHTPEEAGAELEHVVAEYRSSRRY